MQGGRGNLGRAISCAAVAGCAAAFSLLAGCAQDTPPPLASALVVVDTDLPVPRTLSRLRVDIYGNDGTWLHSRDVPLARADEWPASFGVFSPDQSKETTVVLRVRGYVEGATRDYRGARTVVAPTYTAPWTAASNAELCARLETLPPFEERTLRRSAQAVITDTCSTYGGFRPVPRVLVGSVGVRIEIATAGTYRFEVVRSLPDADEGTDTSLSLRRDCNDAQTEIACNDEVSAVSSLSRLVLDLAPGTYTLLTGGAESSPADLTLRWAPAGEWDRPSLAPRSSAPDVPRDAWPRLVPGGTDKTPSQEPHPAATVDRLVRVQLEPGVQKRVRVTLEGACAGAEATVAQASDRRVALDALRTCRAGDPFATVDDAATDDGGPSRVGSFSNEPCTADDSDDGIVCVPGSAYVMGGPELDLVYLTTESRTLPVRIVGLRRFYIDRREVTVGRYRQALAAGLQVDLTNGAIANDGPLEETTADFRKEATFSTRPMGRESHPVNSIDWSVARALCVRAGGDLPTEAQWEYAAGAAGRDIKAAFPTGSIAPSCDVGVIARTRVLPAGSRACNKLFAGTEAVDSAAAAADVNALGILGLTGNVAEFTRSPAYPFDHPCWAASNVVDPTCDDPTAPVRVGRGGSWRAPPVLANVTGRQPTSGRTNLMGFRCAYDAPPAKRWSGL